MASQTLYDQTMRGEARRLIAQHGDLVEVRCLSGPPEPRIELVFADGHQEIITRHSGGMDISMMKFGYSGTGTECFWAFLDEAGFKDVSLEQLQTMEGPQVLHKDRPVAESPVVEDQPYEEAAREPELPLWEDVSRDPSLLDPLILQQLEKSMCITVRDESGPVSALVVRCTGDELRGPIDEDTPMSLYVHPHAAPSFELYGVYPVVWDDPQEPFFKETWLVGAADVTGPADPLSEGQLARLEALLTQEYTYFLLVDRSNRVVAARKVRHTPATQEHFLGLLPRVRAARGLTISNTGFIAGVTDYMNRVSLEEVRTSAARLAGIEVAPPEAAPATPARAESTGERVYPWQGISSLRRLGLGLWAMVQLCLCSGVAGYVMSGFDPGPIVYLLVLVGVLVISGATMFQALRPTTIREVVISRDRGLLLRHKSGKEKPVIAKINQARETQRGKMIRIDGRTSDDKYVRAQIGRLNLGEAGFWRFRDDLERLIPGVKIQVPSRRPIVRRLLAGLFCILGVLALVGFLFFAGATVHDHVKGLEFESIPLQTQVAIVLALFVTFVLFAGLSAFLSSRPKVGIALWTVFLVLGLVGTGGILNYMLQEEGAGLELPVLGPLEMPITRGSPTLVPTPGSPAADQVIAYSPGSAQNAQYSDPRAALGAPDLVEQPCCSGMLQLGAGGSVLLAFSDNVIRDDSGPDFQIFGESARDDFILVEVSADGQVWRSYPQTDECPEPFDLADVGLEEVVFVRITDVQPGTATGAELDAVEALHSGSPLAGGIPKNLDDALARVDLTLKQEPGEASDAVCEVPADSPLSVQGCSGDAAWTQVTTPDGHEGWCSTAQLALNVSLAGYREAEPAASPPAAPPPAPTAAPPPAVVELGEALVEGLAQATMTGQGLERMDLVLESLSDGSLEISISAGTIFLAQTGGTQNMVVRRPRVVELPSRGSKESLTISVACANMELNAPEESDHFTVNAAPAPEDLIKLLNLPAFLEEPFRVQQFAIWTITDNPPRGGYVGLGYFGVGSGPDEEEMQQIRALFQQAGIPTERYQALQ